MRRDDKIIDEAYRAWVKKGDCLVAFDRAGTDCFGPIDLDHTKARGTESHKQNDFFILELCRKHHSERGQIGDEKFQAKYGINLREEIIWNLIEYILELKKVLRARNSEKGGRYKGFSF